MHRLHRGARHHLYHHMLWFCLIALVATTTFVQLPPVTAAETQTITYATSDTIFPNPERGWYFIQMPYGSVTRPLHDVDFDGLRQQNITMIRQVYLLDKWRNQALPQSLLDTMQADFDLVRENGFKIILKFSYNWVHSETGNQDASVLRIDQHLDQMQPLLEENEDVIAFLEESFVGYWGEWHDSTSGHVIPMTLTLTDEGRQAFNRVADYLPSRMWSSRYGQQLMQIYETPLADEDVFTTARQARVGLFNAGFRSDPSDFGSWSTYDPELEAQEKAFAEQSTAYTIQSGEPGGIQDPANAAYAKSRDGAIADWSRFHYSALAVNQSDAEATGQYDAWKQNGAYDVGDRRFGYRFRLIEATLPKTATANEQLSVSVQMANDGWARPYNPRDLEVVLRHTETDAVVRLQVETDQDMRLFLPGPGETKDLSLAVALPEDIASGDYKVLLNLPDPAATLNDRPEYSIRLANHNVWEASTGYNKLNATLQVESGALDVPSVTSLILINADTDQALQELQDGEILDLSTLNAANLSIRANTEPTTVGSVQFVLDDQLIKTENYVPYTIAGDANQGKDYLPWQFPASGEHTLTAIPYSSVNGEGLPGQDLTIKLSSIQTTETRDPWLWPFAQDSIWNTPIGSDAVYAPANFEPNATLGGDNVYLLKLDRAHPARPVYGHNSWGPGRCTGSNLGFDWHIPNDFIIPDAGEGNPDGLTPNNPFAFLLPDGNTVFEAQVLARCEPDGPVYVPSWLAVGDNPETARRDIYGDGIDGQSTRYGGFGHGASGMSALGGTIRKGELTSDTPIRHPIKLTMWAKKYLYYDENDTTPGYRWPATGADNYAGDPNNPSRYQGSNPDIEMGTLLAIPPDVSAESLGLQTDSAKKLFAAMQDYGVYIVEDSAWDNALLVWEKGVEAELNAIGINPSSKDDSFFQDVNTLFQSLHAVTNNGPDTIGGGGTPRVPLAPPFANQ
ncbi:MAG: hypothetical protein GFH27_549283n192 [Chloroflexi bacterium AL-W]|nr:hypothetical protein [Chloroflexi bacterium AL-N1]NOK64687.1 hypothetical protein [Chloroflexi bacterium AL-N10]NOK75928.1 hypothetical protein [Chloroflexi bacterium AL-N5]NOK80313.1 hypothetical protein [Chloroflexi bacterium AL-W]NOK86826.1 hypothetical protein [Chloroflexi bacterium AL-N15]